MAELNFIVRLARDRETTLYQKASAHQRTRFVRERANLKVEPALGPISHGAWMSLGALLVALDEKPAAVAAAMAG